MEEEQIVCVYPSTVRTLMDWIHYIAFFTDRRIVLAKLDISSGAKGLAALGAAGGAAGSLLMRNQAIKAYEKMKEDAQLDLDGILGSHKKNLEIPYDQIQQMEYKPGKKWSAPVLTISGQRALYKKKNIMKLGVHPDYKYIEDRKAEGIGEAKSYISFSNDLLEILKPVLGDLMRS